MFRIIDKNGQMIAQPAAPSELQTYLDTSFPGWKDRVTEQDDENNFAIANQKGEPLVTVQGPRVPAKRQEEPARPPSE